MTYLMDTDHLSVLQRRSGAEWAKLSARMSKLPPGEIGLSVVTFHEQALGCHTYIKRAKTTAAVVHGYAMFDRLIADFSTATVVPFDVAAGTTFDSLQTRRLRIGTSDLRIAAIALSRGLKVLTRNAADFGKVPGLDIEDWTR